MSRCEKCNITILDHTDKCPLCRHVLKQDGGEVRESYPDAVRVTRRFHFMGNVVLFLSLIAAVVTGVVNYMVNPDILWSLVVILILIYANAVLQLAVAGRSGYMFKTLMLVILAVVLLLGIDYLTGYHGWALDYVLPGGILLIDAGILILELVNRRNWQSYMMPQLLMILLSFIPVLLKAVGIIQFPYLTYLALAGSVFLFLGTLILGDRRARTELYRRFHM